MRPPHRQRGFTLIELLIAASLVCLMSVTVFSALSSALNVAGRAQERDVADHEAWLTLERLFREYQNGVLFPGLPIRGSAGRVSFPSIVGALSRDAGDRRLAYVEYGYDPAERSLYRREVSHAQAFTDEPAARRNWEVLLKNVDALSIRYLGFDKKIMKRRWFSDWEDAGRFPMAIRVDLEVSKEGRRYPLTRTVYARIPR